MGEEKKENNVRPIRNKYFHLLGCQIEQNVSHLKTTAPHHLAEPWHHYLQLLHLVYYEMLPNRQEGMREVPWRGLICSFRSRNVPHADMMKDGDSDPVTASES